MRVWGTEKNFCHTKFPNDLLLEKKSILRQKISDDLFKVIDGILWIFTVK